MAEDLGNVIGALGEYCTKNGYPLPVYQDEEKSGQPHNLSFVISCKVGNIKEHGMGSSKKTAKKDAAQKVLLRIKEEGLSTTSAQNGTGEPELTLEERNLIEKMQCHTNIRLETLSVSGAEEVRTFYMKMRAVKGEKLRELCETPLSRDEDFLQLLKDIGNEQEFEVRIERSDHKTDFDDYQCTIHIVQLPFLVTFGIGEEMTKAEQHAARAALFHIKLMTETAKK